MAKENNLRGKEKLLQQNKVSHRKKTKNTTKDHEKNITRNEILRKEKKIFFENFSRLLRLLCSTSETLICCSR